MTVIEAAQLEIAKGHVPVAQYKKEKFAKYPKMKGWRELTLGHPMLRKQGWPNAEGIGVVLGPVSKNLAVLDIDDVEFSSAVFARLMRGKQPFRFVHTASNRGHLHIYERIPTEHKVTKRVKWEGKEFSVELRCQGGLATIPPTPGYTLARDVEPQTFDNIAAVWAGIALAFGVQDLTPTYSHDAWAEQVNDGDRNETLFTEARYIAQSGMPIRLGMEHMRIRWEAAYAGQFDEKEFRDTVTSAYNYVRRKRAIANNERYEVEKKW